MIFIRKQTFSLFLNFCSFTNIIIETSNIFLKKEFYTENEETTFSSLFGRHKLQEQSKSIISAKGGTIVHPGTIQIKLPKC